jgi:D-alanyl-D-alanine carboxypeptidase
VRQLVFVLAALIALGSARPAAAEIGSYLLFDMEDGEILAMHEPTRPWYPASLTKLMTAWVTFEAVRDGELKLTSPVAITPQAHRQPPSRMGFSIGTVLTVETALRIILTKSANDVSIALAEAVGGTQEGFSRRMNRAAAELGMVSSHFDNPHGLPDRHQRVTARDVALLMMALAEEFPERADFFTMSGVVLGGRRHRNYNVLITRFPGADGMKTGFICASGFNLAATATRDGVRLGAVVLGGLNSRERDERTAELLAKGFQAHRTGGRVELDGFDDPQGGLAVVPVSGEREPLGTVSALAADPDAEVADRRDEVCGARRPVTRYTGGTVDTMAEVEAQREAMAAWRRAHEEREAARAAALSAPRVLREPIAPTQRAVADAALAPEGWQADTPPLLPLSHPRRDAEIAPPAEASAQAPSIAPEGWEPQPWIPLRNPLFAAGLGTPPPERPPERPLSYLGPRRSVPPTPISVGGADPSRPAPLSGSIVGGGPPPVPRARPVPPVEVFQETVDPEVLAEHVEAVRAGSDDPASP